MTHEEIRDLLPAYALGALDAEERGRVAAHLVGCPECRREYVGYAEVADTLPDALALAAPSTATVSAKSRLLAAAQPRRRTAAVLGAAATVVLIALVASLLWGLRLNDALAEERARTQHLTTREEIVFEVVDAPSRTKLALRPPLPGSSAYGKVFTRPDLPYVVAMAGRLPEPPAGKVYHLWLTFGDGRTVRGGVLYANPAGFGSLIYDAGRNDPRPEHVRVTLDRQDARKPSGVPVLLWDR
jgi:hypothetical protein